LNPEPSWGLRALVRSLLERVEIAEGEGKIRPKRDSSCGSISAFVKGAGKQETCRLGGGGGGGGQLRYLSLGAERILRPARNEGKHH